MLTNKEIRGRIDSLDALDPSALQMENRKACGTRGASQKDIVDIGRLAGDLQFHVILVGPLPGDFVGRRGAADNGVGGLSGLFECIGHALETSDDRKSTRLNSSH